MDADHWPPSRCCQAACREVFERQPVWRKHALPSGSFPSDGKPEAGKAAIHETSWVDWSLLKHNRDIFEFARGSRFGAPTLFYAPKLSTPLMTCSGSTPQEQAPLGNDSSQKCIACQVRGQGRSNSTLYSTQMQRLFPSGFPDSQSPHSGPFL